MMVEGNFTFHNVGQGLFYSGQIKNNNSYFNFVYDCGTSTSKKKLNENIDQLSKEISKLDALFISHLHYDHISGISELLKKIKKIKLVFLPYYTPFERFIIALRTQRLTRDYINFLLNPIEYLFKNNKNIENIIIVINERGDEEVDIEELNFKELKTPEEFKKTKYYKKIKTINYSVFHLKKIWKFKLFFEKDENNYKEIKHKLGLDNKTNKEILEVLNNKIADYKKKIKKLKIDLNESSLVLYHSPFLKNNNNKSINSKIIIKNIEADIHKIILSIYKTGTLLTGDCYISNNLLEYYKNEINNIKIMLVPHHGSTKNWNNSFLNNSNLKDIIFIISYGVNNKYNHPHKKVILNILKNKNHIFLINESNKLKYTYNNNLIIKYLINCLI